METQVNQTPLPLRSHTILGVCEAIGEEFGFNPVYLRIPFAASVIYSPTMAIATYLLLGLGVMVSRLAFPNILRGTIVDSTTTSAPANSQVELKKAA